MADGLRSINNADAKQRAVVTDATVDSLLALNATVCVGVSGGKDSQAVAIAVAQHLDAIGHQGARVLVHGGLSRNPQNFRKTP